MKGGEVLPPCINTSRHEAVIRGKSIYLGMGMLNAIEDETIHRILRSREREGNFTDMEDFLDRVPIGVEQIDILIRIDAFRFMGKNKRELLWEARFKLDPIKRTIEQQMLFREPRKDYELPTLESSLLEDAFDQIELLGFPLVDPFGLLENEPDSRVLARDLTTRIGQRVKIFGYLVTRKETSTARGDRMSFGNFVDLHGEFIDTVHFPQVARDFPFRGRGVYCIEGKVTEEFDCYSVEVDRMEKVKLVPDARYVEG
jgi:DNA polymerase-3 subunit alpha